MSDPDDTLDSSAGLDAMGRLVDRAAAGEDAEVLLDGAAARDVMRGLDALRGALHVREDEVQAVLDDEAVVPDMSGIPPELPEDFELQGELGRGGMGVVYRARQRSLDRTVAIKVLSPGELLFGHALRRFHREAKTLAKLRHAHIVSVHEVGTTAGRLWFSMDYVAGDSLAERLKRRPLSPSQSVRLMKQVIGAVAYVHAHGVVHRDLKPANILLNEAGDAYVTDFGLALEVDAEASLTQTGQVLGTPAWMAPEQARGKSEAIGEASDIYGLGALLYACLCGKAPVDGETAAEQVLAVLRGEQVALRKRNAHLPPDLIRIVEKALAPKPEHRYGSARAMLEDLERFEAGKAVRAQPPTPMYRVARTVARHRNALFGLGIGVLLGVGLLLALLQDRGRADIDRTLALGQSMLADEDFRAAERMALDVEERLGDELDDERAQRQFARARLLRSRAMTAQGQVHAADRLLDETHNAMDDSSPASWAGAPFILQERAAISRLLGQHTQAAPFASNARRAAREQVRAKGGGWTDWAETERLAHALIIEERPAFLAHPGHPLFALAQRWYQTLPSPRLGGSPVALELYLDAHPRARVGAIHASWSGWNERMGHLNRGAASDDTYGLTTLHKLHAAVLREVVLEPAWPQVVRRSAALVLAIREGVPNPHGLPGANAMRFNPRVDPAGLRDAANRYGALRGEPRWRAGAVDAVAGWKTWKATPPVQADAAHHAARGRLWQQWVAWYLGDASTPEAAAEVLAGIGEGEVASHLARRLNGEAEPRAAHVIDLLAHATDMNTAGAAHHLLALRHPDRHVDIPIGAAARASLVTAWRGAVEPLPTTTHIQLALVEQGPAGWRVVATTAQDLGVGESRKLHITRAIPPEWRARVHVQVPGTPRYREPSPLGFSFSAWFGTTHAPTGPAVQVRDAGTRMRASARLLENPNVGPPAKPLGRVARLAPYTDDPTGRDMLLLLYATDDPAQRLPSDVEDWRALLALDLDRVTLGAGTHKRVPADAEAHAWSPVREIEPDDKETLILAATLGAGGGNARLLELETDWLANVNALGHHVGAMLRLARLMRDDVSALFVGGREDDALADRFRKNDLQQALTMDPGEQLLRKGWAWWRLAREARAPAIQRFAFDRLLSIRLPEHLAWTIQAEHAARRLEVPHELVLEAQRKVAYHPTLWDGVADTPGAAAWSVALWALALLGLVLLAWGRAKGGVPGPALLALVLACFGFLAVDVQVGGYDLVPDALGVLFLLLAALVVRARHAPRFPIATLAPWALGAVVLVLPELAFHPQHTHLIGLALFVLGVPALGPLVAAGAANGLAPARRRWRTEYRSGPGGQPMQLLRRGGLLVAALILVLNVGRAGWLPLAFGAGLVGAYALWGRWARRRGGPPDLRAAVLGYVVPAAVMHALMWRALDTTPFPDWARRAPDIVEILLPALCLVTLLALLTPLVKLGFRQTQRAR